MWCSTEWKLDHKYCKNCYIKVRKAIYQYTTHVYKLINDYGAFLPPLPSYGNSVTVYFFYYIMKFDNF